MTNPMNFAGRRILITGASSGIGRETAILLGTAGYGASKAALLGLTRSLALELAREGIRANSVVPGLVKTEMADQFFSSLNSEQIATVESEHPLGLGTPLDVSYAIAFLLSGAARWITGSALVVDGGIPHIRLEGRIE